MSARVPDDRRRAAAHDGLADLEGYGLDYRPAGPAAPSDQGIRAGDRYIAAHDPLRARVTAPGGASADVELGVDPGTFYCGAQMATLLDLVRAPPFAGATRVGFVHVPPDRAGAAEGSASDHLLDRASNLELAARVLAVALRGLSEGTDELHVVLTGFGPFVGVADNPSAAIVGDPAGVGRALALASPGIRRSVVDSQINDVPEGIQAIRQDFEGPAAARRWIVTSLVLPLAPTRDEALRGAYFPPGVMADRFRGALAVALAGGPPPTAITSLGVDSSQLRRGRRPAFRIETQTRGWHPRGAPEAALAAFHRDLSLARIFMAARGRGDPLLGDRPGR